MSLRQSLIVSVSIDHRGLDQRHRWAYVDFFDTDSCGRLDAANSRPMGVPFLDWPLSGPWAPSTWWNARSRIFVTKSSVAS